MQSEHRHLPLVHEHPFEHHGEYDHQHAPDWFPWQRRLDKKLRGMMDVVWRFIMGADGYFYNQGDYFFVKLAREGDHLHVQIRLTGAPREAAEKHPAYEPHPLLLPEWTAFTITQEAHLDDMEKFIDDALEQARAAKTEAPTTPGATFKRACTGSPGIFDH